MRIKEYLNQKGLSACEFARIAGVPTSTITRIITGKVFQARFNTQRKIIKASNGKVGFEDMFPKIRAGE